MDANREHHTLIAHGTLPCDNAMMGLQHSFPIPNRIGSRFRLTQQRGANPTLGTCTDSLRDTVIGGCDDAQAIPAIVVTDGLFFQQLNSISDTDLTDNGIGTDARGTANVTAINDLRPANDRRRRRRRRQRSGG